MSVILKYGCILRVHNHFVITYSNKLHKLATLHVHLDGLPQTNSQKELQTLCVWGLLF